MSPILNKQRLTPDIAMFEVEAPRIAKRWKAGQFVIVRPREDSERIPLTLVISDAGRGSITLVVQAAGKTPLSFRDVDADHAVARVGEAGPRDEPDVAGTDDGDAHGRRLLEVSSERRAKSARTLAATGPPRKRAGVRKSEAQAICRPVDEERLAGKLLGTA